MNKYRFALIMGLSVASVAVSGCATVLNGTSQPVAIKTDPDGSHAKLITGLECDTPCSIELRRGDDNQVMLTKPGYKTEVLYIQSRMGGSAFGNVIAGGLIGGAVDATNGASNHLYPNPVYVKMVPEGSSDKATLLDKKGKLISTVEEHNAKVEKDVRATLEKRGLKVVKLEEVVRPVETLAQPEMAAPAEAAVATPSN